MVNEKIIQDYSANLQEYNTLINNMDTYDGQWDRMIKDISDNPDELIPNYNDLTLKKSNLNNYVLVNENLGNIITTTQSYNEIHQVYSPYTISEQCSDNEPDILNWLNWNDNHTPYCSKNLTNKPVKICYKRHIMKSNVDNIVSFLLNHDIRVRRDGKISITPDPPIDLVEQYSSGDHDGDGGCIKNQSYGITSDCKWIWVKRGCRGRFKTCSNNAYTCESWGMHDEWCYIDDVNNVRRVTRGTSSLGVVNNNNTNLSNKIQIDSSGILQLVNNNNTAVIGSYNFVSDNDLSDVNIIPELGFKSNSFKPNTKLSLGISIKNKLKRNTVKHNYKGYINDEENLLVSDNSGMYGLYLEYNEPLKQIELNIYCVPQEIKYKRNDKLYYTNRWQIGKFGYLYGYPVNGGNDISINYISLSENTNANLLELNDSFKPHTCYSDNTNINFLGVTWTDHPSWIDLSSTNQSCDIGTCNDMSCIAFTNTSNKSCTYYKRKDQNSSSTISPDDYSRLYQTLYVIQDNNSMGRPCAIRDVSINNLAEPSTCTTPYQNTNSIKEINTRVSQYMEENIQYDNSFNLCNENRYISNITENIDTVLGSIKDDIKDITLPPVDNTYEEKITNMDTMFNSNNVSKVINQMAKSKYLALCMLMVLFIVVIIILLILY